MEAARRVAHPGRKASEPSVTALPEMKRSATSEPWYWRTSAIVMSQSGALRGADMLSAPPATAFSYALAASATCKPTAHAVCPCFAWSVCICSGVSAGLGHIFGAHGPAGGALAVAAPYGAEKAKRTLPVPMAYEA